MTQEQYIHPKAQNTVAIKNKQWYFDIYCNGQKRFSADDSIMVAFWFVELPTTDTGKGDDWVYRLYRDRWDCLEKFREKLHYYMPKSVDLVWLTKEKIDELVELLMSYWGNYLARKKKFTEALAPYITGKQEQLMALDVEKVTKEIFDNIPTPYADWQMKRAKLYRIVKTILSKYWVHTQEEKPLWLKNALDQVKDFKRQGVINTKEFSTTTPVTSTIEELAKEIYTKATYTQSSSEDYWLDFVEYSKEQNIGNLIKIINKHLSSLSPMGKKRTKQEVENIFSEEEREWYGDVRYEWAIMFLQKRWLLQE